MSKPKSKKQPNKPTDPKRKRIPRSKSYKLTEPQRDHLLALIAEGLNVREINSVIASFEPPFEVSSQLVSQYRKTHSKRLMELRHEHETRAFNEGLAIAANRVQALVTLAKLLEDDLHTKALIWVEDKKMVGDEKVSFKQFNKAEIQELRGIYDDLAKETGGRISRRDITSGGMALKQYETINPDDWDEEKEE